MCRASLLGFTIALATYGAAYALHDGDAGGRATPATTTESSPRPKTPIGLGDVIHASVLGDLRIASALENVRMAEGDVTTASLLPNPTLSVTQTLNPLPGRPFTKDEPGGPPQLDASVGYSLDAIVFGKRSAAMEAARRAVDVTAAAQADVVRVRVLEAIQLYYDVLEAKALFELAVEAHTQVTTLAAITTQRVTLGSVGSLEQDRVRLALLSAHRDMLRADAEVDKRVADLRARLGKAWVGKELEIVGSLDVTIAPPAPSLDDALASAEASRPDRIAATRNVARAGAALKAERRNAWPSLSVSLVYSRQFQRSIGATDVSAWGAGLETTLPIFDRNQGGIAKAAAERRQAELDLDASRLEIRADVERALREYTVAREIVTQDVVATLGAAGAAREKILESYRLGGRTLIEVLDAQNAYREATRLTIEARAGFWKAKHALNASLGKELLPR